MERLGLDIELTNICNARCSICDRKSMQEQGLGVMSQEVYDTLIEKGVPYLRIMSFGGIGDPFLDPSFWMRIDTLLEKIDACGRKKQIYIFVYSKMQNMKPSDFEKIKQIQDSGYNFVFYLSVFTFREKYYHKLTGLSFSLFQKNFALLRKMKIKYKINFTLTRYGVDELPFLIKNFSNYQIETIHDFRGEINRDDFLLDTMRNISFSARENNVPPELQVSSFCITHTGDFRYTDKDSRRDVQIGNITQIGFQEASDIYDKIEKSGLIE